ncbi:MAG: Ribosomal large subunit pseudouridine synthase [Pseudomonadota bacterium]
MSETQADKSPVQILEVGEHNTDQRIDNFLVTRLKGVPRTLIYRIIRKGEVRINGKRAKPEQKLEMGDKVRVPPLRLAAEKEQQKPGASLQALLRAAVLFEDAELLVLNKPAGLSVHGGTGVKLGLIEALRAMYPELPGLELVHRLDKGTSGCILLAKTGRARRSLTAAFREHQVVKVYHAIVAGAWPKQIRTVDASLQRQPERGGERRVTIDEDGKEARTDFRILQGFTRATLVEARPLTGRTHQIRVHAALAGCPLVGDDKYNDNSTNAAFAKLGIKRLCLHAAEVRFPHPVGGKTVHLKAAYDAGFTQALKTLAQAG